jgi:hypothetical protein
MLGVTLTGWYVGYVIAAVVITIVVVLVARILFLARKIGTQALAITASLNEGREATQCLWEMEKVNDSIRAIIRGAEEARTTIERGM